MKQNLLHVKKELDKLVKKRNNPYELTLEATPDPIQVASLYKNEYIALVCALFSYGNAQAIVNFLNSIDFSLLYANQEKIRQELCHKKYRFQSSEDIIQFFITLKKVQEKSSLQDIFLEEYHKKCDICHALNHLIKTLYAINSYRSRGYTFLIGKTFQKTPISAYKRWHMYLRWMVRNDNLDMGLWKKVDKAHLFAPLDTHTHKMALKLGLVKRKSYDFKTVEELTQIYREFDPKDPIKYDFVLYRLGQEKVISES